MNEDNGTETIGGMLAVGLIGMWVYSERFKILDRVGDWFDLLGHMLWKLMIDVAWLALWVGLAWGVIWLIGYVYSLHEKALQAQIDLRVEVEDVLQSKTNALESWRSSCEVSWHDNQKLKADLAAAKKMLEEFTTTPESKAAEAVASVADALIGKDKDVDLE